jgi:hypothetical protein
MIDNLITELHTEPFPLLTLNNLFSEEERELIFSEIKFLSRGNKLMSPEETGTDYDKEKMPKKNTRGVFVDKVYPDPDYRKFSDILTINRKLFDNKDIFKHLDSWFFKNLEFNFDSTIISYYGDGGYYKGHKDNADITILNWFYEEPKYFTGGDLLFPDYNITVPTSLNTTVIFPSCIKHQVTETHLDKEYKGLGRYVMAQLVGIH